MNTAARWRNGFRTRVNADDALAVSLEIAERDGSVTPQAFVDAARPDDSPIHAGFTWEDAEAAERWRVTEARALLRNLVLIEVIGDERKDIGPAYLNVTIAGPEDGESDDQDSARAYVRLGDVRQSSDLREAALAEAKAGLRSWRRRFEHLRAVLPAVFGAIDEEVDEEVG
jgi:hypothetical protein